jgi:hypothetical protein
VESRLLINSAFHIIASVIISCNTAS